MNFKEFYESMSANKMSLSDLTTTLYFDIQRAMTTEDLYSISSIKPLVLEKILEALRLKGFIQLKDSKYGTIIKIVKKNDDLWNVISAVFKKMDSQTN